MSDDSPRIVSLPTSFDLEAFPSESDETARLDETAVVAAPAAVAPPAVVPPPIVVPSPVVTPPPAPTPAVAAAPLAFTMVEPPAAAGLPSVTSITSIAGALELDVHGRRVASVAEAATSAGPATVTEFPGPASRQPAVAVPTVVPNAVTLIELVEQQGGLDWRRAVSVVHQICLQLKHQESPAHAPIMLEARNILVTHQGDVRLLPSQPGGDPLVIQLGRLLRTILKGNEAPPELRLLLAQATFELPIFESIEDVDRALRQLERIEAAGGDGTGFARPVALPPPAPVEDFPQRPAYTSQSILTKRHAPIGRAKTRGATAPGPTLGGHSLRIAATMAVLVLLLAVLWNRPSLVWPAKSTPARAAETDAPAAASPVTAPALAVERPATTTAPEPASAATVPPASLAAALPPPVVGPPIVERPRVMSPPPAYGARIIPPSARREPVVTRPAAPVAPRTSPRESERRALSLMAQGQTTEAAMAFDALVLANPTYEPVASELTPDALAAFRKSQQLLLPVIALKTYDRAVAALSAGDPERALGLTRDVTAILDRGVGDPQPQLRDQVQALSERAASAKAAADEIVYSENDRGIVPPRSLSRQFPDTTPLGVPPHRVGTLEMIIGRDGGVEYVKLHTPLNRYHERMIVSAAKAWRYRPATKDGRPVRCRITVKINLPESGTDY